MAAVESSRYSSRAIQRVPVENSLKILERRKLAHSELITNAKSVIINFVKRIDITSYEDLVCGFSCEYIDDADLQQLLSDLREIISLLDENLHHLVRILLGLQWFKRGVEAAQEYEGFLIDLLSAHNYYVGHAIPRLVKHLRGVSDKPEWVNGKLDAEEEQWFEKIHGVLRILLKIVPMSWPILHQALVDEFPYYKRCAHEHESYQYNLLKITEYRPDLRLDILLVIAGRLVYLDVNAPKAEIQDFEDNEVESNSLESEIFLMDDSVETSTCAEKMVHPIANTFDIVLTQMFKYLHASCYCEDPTLLNWEATKLLYQELLVVFERIILPTYNAHHVQFIMFYVCSFKVTIAEAFLNFLWHKVSSPNEAPIIRQTAVLYIASLLARATFIPVSILKDIIARMATWIHNYISCQDGLESINSDVRVHSVFLSVCQALFYIIAFRHGDLVNTRKNLTFLQSLNLTKMVTCRLNPLRACIPPVVQNFAAVTRTYQLAYCYTIIEHNSRNFMPVIYKDNTGERSITGHEYLETFFPFDPVLLKRSSQLITPIYREFQAVQATKQEPTPLICAEEEDDFLIDQSPSTNTVINPDLFTYSSSPGFKHK